MAVETFANDATTRLNGAISSSQLTITVLDASVFPQTGQYRLKIEDEYLLVTGGHGTNTLDVLRGAEGSVAAAHADATDVNHVLTAGVASRFVQDEAFEEHQLASDPHGTLPPGIIVMWAGTIATVPAGWALCDGTNGTPNLADRFIVGETITPGGSGGTVSPTSALPTHGGHAAHSDHAAHQHQLPFGDNGTANLGRTLSTFGHSGSLSIDGVVAFAAAGGAVSALLTGANAAQSHSAHSAHDAHGTYKYFKLAFIMKL